MVSSSIVFGLTAAISLGVGGAEFHTIPTGVGTVQTCPGGCRGFSLVSASLETWNFTDELGASGYSNLTLHILVDPNATLERFEVFVGGTLVDSVGGPIGPGTDKSFILALPQTYTFQRGGTYQVTVEGFVEQGGASSPSWKAITVVAA